MIGKKGIKPYLIVVMSISGELTLASSAAIFLATLMLKASIISLLKRDGWDGGLHGILG